MAKHKITFEEAIARLDEILHALEKGDADLDTSLALYEEGVGLLRACNSLLENAEQRVKMLRLQADGSAELVDFGAAEEETK